MRSALAHAAQARAQRRQRSNSLKTVPPAETSNDYDDNLAVAAASILYQSPLPSKTGRPIYILNAAAFPDAFEVDYDSLLSYVLARLPGEDELLSGTEYEIIFFAGGSPEGATSEKKQGPALQIPIEKLLIPPTVYLHDRKLSPDIYVPFVTGKRAFGVKHPLPKNINTGETRLPRVLRETTSFILMPQCVKMEGLFRIPPHSILASALKEAYDRGQYFIVWKEKDATLVQPGIDQALVDEVRLEDAYGAHLAASLIKQWYRDLREPIFPESSYEALKERFGSPDTEIQPEALVDLILPQAEASPLSKISRKILMRQLLPMLAEVAAHEPENKMNAENLAILFSMCLVCGSNQLEDAKIASVLKRVLQAAIEFWPELRTGMDLSRESFFLDLEGPVDLPDYEDPLEEEEVRVRPRSRRLSEDDVVEGREGHRIVLEDSEAAPAREEVPTLPPRRPQNGDVRKQAPNLPPRPSNSSSASPTNPHPDPSCTVPKRKPAPPVAEPPRYSTVFDGEGNSLHVADSPASYAPANGFGPPRRGQWSYDEGEKKGFVPPPTYDEPVDPHPALNMPKRKGLSGEHSPADTVEEAAPPTSTADATSASDSGLLARRAAQKAATNLAQQVAAVTTARGRTNSGAVESLSEGDGAFRKPTWPASAAPQGLAKPVLPPRKSQTVPMISLPENWKGNDLTVPHVPKPRTPSPGLLKRMSTMEVSNDNSSLNRNTLEPRRLNLKKASLEDLRRLYEERVSTAQSLARAEAARRSSSST
ncbi:hypothetical protein LTR37_021339 [Vermiconidia calcicola]|uniref:Uncharacterized protein n=1 Tax=Vermiconidia calcicola TaxID=1690605 RepID=A0ACC3M950_9PEZI|nr:hypothetical protein LTR37_021339 [Vermiconidia calcicola]